MKQMSYWAKANTHIARILIILIYILINIAGLVAGSLLRASGIQLEESFMFMLAVTVVSLYLNYPKKAGCYKRKFFHGLMTVCTFLIITGLYAVEPKRWLFLLHLPERLELFLELFV